MQLLSGRGTETGEVILQRLQRAVAESEGIEDYDYVFVNDRIDDCADRMHELIQAQRNRTKKNADTVCKIRSEILEACRTMEARAAENIKD